MLTLAKQSLPFEVDTDGLDQKAVVNYVSYTMTEELNIEFLIPYTASLEE